MFERVLIANRGEIAVRAIRTCRELGISPIAVYSEVDRASLHVRMADRAMAIGPAPANESYLVIDRLIDAARRTKAQAVYPGYGFLAENAAFAQACADAGLVFIGPSPAVMRTMGDKRMARQAMQQAGVPVVPGAHGEAGGLADAAQALNAARQIGLPVMLKAAAGGGGKGMRLVREEGELASAFDAARREARAAFGDDTIYLEKLIRNPRHVEVQVLGDAHGGAVHFYERDCSVQRRHQKVIEETPCPVLDEETRRAMGEVAVRAAQAVGYVGAGTIEFLYDPQQRSFYFLEMNTRLQVEHPITELCCGVDLVREQLRVAAGEPIDREQAAISQSGAAIECRIYAEDPVRFLPSPGRIHALRVPGGPGIRDDSGVYPGAEISPYYDPLISKLCVWAPTRADAIARARRALGEYRVVGIQTNIAFHQRVLEHPAFGSGVYDTGFIEAYAEALRVSSPEPRALDVAAAIVALERGPTAGSADHPRSTGVTDDDAPAISAWRRSVFDR